MQKNRPYQLVRKLPVVNIQDKLDVIILEDMCAETTRQKINNTLYCKNCGKAFHAANIALHPCAIQNVTFLFGGDKRWNRGG